MREFEIIDKFFVTLMNQQGKATLDDSVVFTPLTDQQVVMTTDTCIADVHFRRQDPARRIAQKALRVNLSDLAAMGARPFGYLLNINLPEGIDETWLAQFTSGLAQDQEDFGISLLGGDTSKTPGPLTISITALGYLPPGTELARSYAEPGDRIYVSGTLGDSALGLQILNDQDHGFSDEMKDYFVDRYQLPEPRIELGQKLRNCGHAAIDISDGFLGDLQHLCKCSDLAAFVNLSFLPISSYLQEFVNRSSDTQKEHLLNLILNGGNDYELIFTAPPSEGDHLEFLAKHLNIPLTAVGHLGPYEEGDSSRIQLLNEHSQPIHVDINSYEHQWEEP